MINATPPDLWANSSRRRGCSAWIPLILTLAACGDDQTEAPEIGAGSRRDSFLWPDYGAQDFGPFKRDKLVKKDAGPRDRSPDSQEPEDGSCPPVQASCSGSCAADELCTEAEGGSCVHVATLAGESSNKEVVLAFLMAVIPTWKQGPDDHTLCATLDTCQLKGDLTAQMVEDWMCKEAQILDFPTAADYEAGRDICGCGIYINDMDWQVSVISPSERGKICLTYHTTFYDEVFVDECKNFPY